MEILSATIYDRDTHKFTFSKPVQQFMVGFSELDIKYSTPDHHVKRILLNLTDVTKEGNNVLVKPILEMCDTSDHYNSCLSCVTVVVIAMVGDKLPNILLLTDLKTNVNYNIPFTSATFVKSALTYASTEFPKEDHHLNLHYSYIESSFTSNKFSLKGESFIQDHGKKSGSGYVFGSAFIYGGDQSVLSGDFDSQKIGDSGKIYLGKINSNFQPNDYKLACFINKYEVTYGVGLDHHVLEINVSVDFKDDKLICQNNEAYANVRLKSYLRDNEKHIINIPTNEISGFIIAINNKSLQNAHSNSTNNKYDKGSDASISSNENFNKESTPMNRSVCSYPNNDNRSLHLQNENIHDNNSYYDYEYKNNNNAFSVDNSNYNYNYSCNCCILI